MRLQTKGAKKKKLMTVRVLTMLDNVKQCYNNAITTLQQCYNNNVTMLQQCCNVGNVCGRLKLLAIECAQRISFG
jgi:hypothetical protein